jgi:hypothetical protein
VLAAWRSKPGFSAVITRPLCIDTAFWTNLVGVHRAMKVH